jgi:hypothetical protein
MGKMDVQLLNIYRKSIIQANQLLDIYFREKEKRGTFTYQKLPQANMKPASDSLENASLFFKNNRQHSERPIVPQSPANARSTLPRPRSSLA